MVAALAAKDGALAKQACLIVKLRQQSSPPMPLTVATAAGGIQTCSTTASTGLWHLSFHMAPMDAAQPLASNITTFPRTSNFMQRLTGVRRMLDQTASALGACNMVGNSMLHLRCSRTNMKNARFLLTALHWLLASPASKLTTTTLHQAPVDLSVDSSAATRHLAFAICTPTVDTAGIKITMATAATTCANSSTTLFASTVTPVAGLHPSKIGVFGAFGAALASDLSPTHHTPFCSTFDLDMPFLLVASHSPTATTAVGPSTSTHFGLSSSCV
jgi:hypothetical protein